MKHDLSRQKIFRRKQQNDECLDLKRRVNYQKLQEKTDFSKVKLIPQRDNLDVSKKNGKEKICLVFLYEL